MHQLKILILGPASFTATLDELKPFLKFNCIKEKNSSDFDVILFHEEALNDEANNKIIINSKGKVSNSFSSITNPSSKKFISYIEKEIKN